MIRDRAIPSCPVGIGLALILAFFIVGSGRAEAKRVLYLGDSLSMGSFGKTLDTRLRESGHDVFTYVTGGATPYYWLSLYAPMKCTIGHWEKTPGYDRRVKVVTVPKVETLLDRHKPEITIVQTGVNLYASLRSKRRSKQENVAEVSRLIENMCKTIRASGSTVYWITPPRSHPDRYPDQLQDEMASIMKRTAGRYGFVFESGRVTRFTDPYPKTDGIHYGPTEAGAWARKVSAHLVPWSGANPPVLVASRDRVPREADGRQTVPTAHAPGEAKVPRPEIVRLPAESEQADDRGGTANDDDDIFVVRKARDADSPSDVVVVDMVLRRVSTTPPPSAITYKSALAIYEWEVVNVEKGSYPHRFIRVAHPVYWHGRVMPAARFEPGKRWSLELAVLSTYPSLEQLQTIDDLEIDLDLPVYIARM